MDQEWGQRGNQKLSGNKWKWTHNNSKLIGHSKGSPEREVHSDTGLSKKKKTRKISNKQPNPNPTRTQRTTTKTDQRK